MATLNLLKTFTTQRFRPPLIRQSFQLQFPKTELETRVQQQQRPLTLRYQLSKRILDITGALSLLFLTSPLLILVAVLIRISSSGPVIFQQQRIGFQGKLFTIHKFRTMYSEAPKYGYHPSNDQDPRITPIGKWLRRLSLDELPQLWNVLRGEMSLVGPRPEMPFIVTTYSDYQLRRLTVKPGLTGLWQISSDRGLPIHENLQHDFYYISQVSLGVDLGILSITPVILALGKVRGQ